MNRRFLALLPVVVAAAACAPSLSVPVSVPLPAVSPFSSSLIGGIVVAGFRSDAEPGGFDTGRELQAYLLAELKRSFKGPVSALALSPDDTRPFDDAAFWKREGGAAERTFLLTGRAALAAQTRKALLKGGLPDDGPFKNDRHGLIEQRHYVLTVDLFVISAATGESLYKKNFREERDYLDLETPAEFAFAELADRVRGRLFPVLFGTATMEDRALLRR